MKLKRYLSLLLCGALLTGTVMAAGGEEAFPAVNTYPGYADVKETDWFYSNAKLCYEIGIMTGTDVGFEPNKVLTTGECVTLAARVKAALRGETIPAAAPGDAWWTAYNGYLFSDGPSDHGINSGDDYAGRDQFLYMLYKAFDGYEASILTPINHIEALPDPDLANGVTVLQFYNAGILTGVDKYGTFAGARSLTRAEAAAMVSRVARSELRLSFAPADFSMFTAARFAPDEQLFPTGVTAEEYLITLNNAITAWEDALGDNFNWHHVWSDGKTALEHVKDDTLSALGVSQEDGAQFYRDFDVQVYYARLIDLRGGPLGSAAG